MVGRGRGRLRPRARERRHEGRRRRRAARARGAARGRAPHGEVVLVAVASEEDGGLGDVRRARARQRVRRVPDPRADGLRRRLRPGRRADVRGHRARASPPTPRTGWRASRRSTATCRSTPRSPAHERALNATVEHPLMRALELPVPAARRAHRGGGVVEQRPRPARLRGPRAGARRRGAGRARARRSRPSSPRRATAPSTCASAAGSSRPARRRRTTRSRGSCAPRSAPRLGREARVAGVPWGADMRLWCARGIPCVMAGPPGIELAHAVDERVAVADLVTRRPRDRAGRLRLRVRLAVSPRAARSRPAGPGTAGRPRTAPRTGR